ncbi:MAG: hypothetical protein AAF571_01165 [Verrucomicrobiota bacterium]
MSDTKSSRVKETPLSDDPIQRAIDYGIDISLLEVNLSKTYEERVEQHDSALEFALLLREAGRIHHGQ